MKRTKIWWQSLDPEERQLIINHERNGCSDEGKSNDWIGENCGGCRDCDFHRNLLIKADNNTKIKGEK